ncbi:RDD family protein [Catenuloplanes sp. NPDC051500]|uniref:RDD family protein n=1 Tax=Catenuloplanes sp. NPDC051500 TaxID=3363959 RepID=UPI0037ABF383
MSNLAYPSETVTQKGTSGDVHVTGRRVVANILDGILLTAVGAGFLMAFGVETETAASTAGTSSMAAMSPTGTALYGVFAIAYYVVMEALAGRTAGKMLTGIRIVDEATGNAPSWGQAILRTLLRIVDGFFGYLVGFVVVLSNDRRRRVGDMVAKTLVVRA